MKNRTRLLTTVVVASLALGGAAAANASQRDDDHHRKQTSTLARDFEAVTRDTVWQLTGKQRLTATFDITLVSGDAVNGQFRLNGVAQAGDIVLSGTAGRFTMTRSWTVTLTPGTYTLTIGGQRFSGSGASTS